MPVTFVLGRAGAGKTRHCVSGVAAALRAADAAPRLLLLTPEQATFQMERALAAETGVGGFMRAEVVSFSRLTMRVFGAESPATLSRVLRPSARALAICALAQRHGDRFKLFGRGAHTAGFYDRLGRTIDEFLRHGATAAQIRAGAEKSLTGPSLERVLEVANLYEAYVEWLGDERVDPTQRLALLRRQAADSAWLRDAEVWVDGFASFTGEELATLMTLARVARRMTITLLVEPERVLTPTAAVDEFDLFSGAVRAYHRLIHGLERESVELTAPIVLRPQTPPRFKGAPMLARLERGLAGESGQTRAGETPVPAGPRARLGETSAPPVADDGAVRVVACETLRDEVACAARWIRGHVADSGGTLRFRDFAIITRELEPCAATISDVLTAYEIPFFLDRRRPLAAHALTRFVAAMCDFARSDLGFAAGRRLLQTDLTRAGRRIADRLIEWLDRHEPVGVEAWTRPMRGNPARTDAARGRIISAAARLQKAALGDSRTGAQWARAVFAAAVEIGLRKRMTGWILAAERDGDPETAALHAQAWEAWRETLDDAGTLLSDTRMTFTEFANLLVAALKGRTLGLAPPTLDQALVSGIERSRHPDIRHAWLLQFNEGVFPARPVSSGVLSASERAALSETAIPELRDDEPDAAGERMLAYVAFTRASDSLTISFARGGAGGEAAHPSPLLLDVKDALPELPATIRSAHQAAPPVTPRELAQLELRAALSPEDTTTRTRVRVLLGALKDEMFIIGRAQRYLNGRTYRNQAEPLAPRPPDGNGVVWRPSPTELSDFLLCPFKHFARRTLRIKPERGPDSHFLTLGNATHAVLAHAVGVAIGKTQEGHSLEDLPWEEITRAAIDAVRGQIMADKPGDVALFDLQRAPLTRLMLAHVERWKCGEMAPFRVEWGFGEAEELPPLRVSTKGGDILLGGKIDRVDRGVRHGAPYYLVYDYKAKAEAFRGKPLIAERFQGFVYLLALMRSDALEQNAQPGGVLIAPTYAGDLKHRDGLPSDTRSASMEEFKPRGLLAESAGRLVHPGDGKSPVGLIQWTKKGGFHASYDVIHNAELAEALTQVEAVLAEATEQYARGEVTIAPLDNPRPCKQCGFRSVCRFEAEENGVRSSTSLPTLVAKGGKS